MWACRCPVPGYTGWRAGPSRCCPHSPRDGRDPGVPRGAGTGALAAGSRAIFALALYVADSTMVSTRIYGGMLRIPMFVVLVACSSGPL